MLAVSGSRVTRVVAASAVMLIMAAGTHDADAKQKTPHKPIFDELVTPSMLAPVTAPQQRSASGPRFFSINSVLAKLDGKPSPEAAVRIASAKSDDVMSDATNAMGYGASADAEPFGLVSFRAPEGSLWRKWKDLGRQIETDVATLAACRSDQSQCAGAASRFAAIVDEVRAGRGKAQIEIANRLINRAVIYTSDLIQHGVLDRWSAPLETISSGRGDCEDYAVAKYIALREAGVAETDLRILLGRDKTARQDHAVLAVRSDGAWIILDNRWLAAKTDAETSQFTPLYALDRGGVSLFASPYLSSLFRDAAGMAPASAGTDVEANDTGTMWNDADKANAREPAMMPTSNGSHEPANPLLL